MPRPNPASGVSIYSSPLEQVKHASETGALRPGNQLPGMAKANRELEHEGVIELQHGTGAFVSGNAPPKRLADKLRATRGVANLQFWARLHWGITLLWPAVNTVCLLPSAAHLAFPR